jgi:1-acyl-sn-glycerol-3-phosphate acyltransferase
MQNIVIDKPYAFVPPYRSQFWVRVLQPFLAGYLNKTWGIESYELRGMDLIRESFAAGNGVLLAPNHSRPCDPMVMGLVNPAIGRATYTMASWHLFMEGAIQRFVIRRIGGFSVYREGMDRESLKAANQILIEGKRPLVIFSEGIVTRTNDRLGTTQEGVAFMARTAAKHKAKATPPGKVVVHPVAIRYFFGGDLAKAVDGVLTDIERRLSWQPQRHLEMLSRITKVGEALLALKELEYFGDVKSGPVPERQQALLDRVLEPLEKEWLKGYRDASVVERMKRLRIAIVPEMATGNLSAEEKTRRWKHLADIYLAQQLDSYPPNYLAEPTKERILETVERFEEDLTDVARIHRPMHVIIQAGQALEVSTERERGAEMDPLVRSLRKSLEEMLQKLAKTR